MAHYLLEKYPALFVPVIEFGDAHPEILPIRRARGCIANLHSQDPEVQRIFRKRFGRWFVHIPSLVAYMERDDSIVGAA